MAIENKAKRMKIKIEFLQFHEGQGKNPGDTGEYSEEIANHLIKFGYGKESGLQRPTEVGEEVQTDGPKQKRDNVKKSNESGFKASS